MVSKIKFLFIQILIPAMLNFYYRFIPRQEKTLLIVECDGIGDYILFRNFLSQIKNSERYRGYKLFLLGNTAYKELSLKLDAGTVDGFYWYSNNLFLKWQYVKLIINLNRLHLESVACLNYSRSVVDDRLISHIFAQHKIGINGDTSNQTAEQKRDGNKIYTRLIEPSASLVHEFCRNGEVVEALTNESCELKRPVIEKDKLNIIPQGQICIFLGGSMPSKKWPSDKVIDLCNSLQAKSEWKIILTGGNAEKDEAAIITHALHNDRIINKAGQTSLVELCDIIGSSQLLFSNDSAAVHIAAAMGIPVVCVAKGELYGRFIPYPEQMQSRVYPIFPPHFHGTDDDYHRWSGAKVADISVDKVYTAISSVLKRSSTNLA